MQNKLKFILFREDKNKDMTYKELINHLIEGGECEGLLNGEHMSLLNISPNKDDLFPEYTLFSYKDIDLFIHDDELETMKIYNNKTLKELLDDKTIILTDIF